MGEKQGFMQGGCANRSPPTPVASACPARTCADINADGTADDAFDCSGETNDIDAAPAGITCAADPCTPTECCTVAPPARTCADINADGTADDAFDCSGETNGIDTAPAGITCAGDACTPTECCTVAPTPAPTPAPAPASSATSLLYTSSLLALVAAKLAL